MSNLRNWRREGDVDRNKKKGAGEIAGGVTPTKKKGAGEIAG